MTSAPPPRTANAVRTSEMGPKSGSMVALLSRLGRQDEQGVDRHAGGDDLEVEVRPCRQAGHPHAADDLTGDDRLTGLNIELGLQMAVDAEDVGPVLNLDDHRAASQATGDRHAAGRDSPDRCADWRADVDAVVEVGVAGALVATGRLE